MILFTAVAVIVGLLLLTLFGVKMRSQEASMEAVQYQAAKGRMMDVVKMVEHDFRNIGAYLYKNGTGQLVTHPSWGPDDVIKPGWYDSSAVSGGYKYRFQFMAQTDSLAPPKRVRYEWEPTPQTVVLGDSQTVNLWNVERYVEDVLNGSASNVTNFQITPSPVIPNLHDIRHIGVSITSVSPLGKGEFMEETRFHAVYRPVGIGLRDHAVFTGGN